MRVTGQGYPAGFGPKVGLEFRVSWFFAWHLSYYIKLDVHPPFKQCLYSPLVGPTLDSFPCLI